MKNKRKNSKSGSLAGSSIRRIRKRKKIRRAVKRLMRLVFAAGIFVLTVVFITQTSHLKKCLCTLKIQ